MNKILTKIKIIDQLFYLMIKLVEFDINNLIKKRKTSVSKDKINVKIKHDQAIITL